MTPTKLILKVLVKITQVEDDSIQTNLSIDPNNQSITEKRIEDLKAGVLADWATRDWSNQPVGQTSNGEDVYLLDLNQIQSISAELDEQPNVDRLPTVGGLLRPDYIRKYPLS